MNTIYMDNFRGFSDTILPLEKVNFFVGENSSGKTSVLALIELFSKYEFWSAFDFNAGTYEFGGFKDIVSVNSTDPTRFMVGVCKNSLDDRDFVASLMTFSESAEGLPYLVKYDVVTGEYLASVLLTEGNVKLFHRDHSRYSDDVSDVVELFNVMKELPAEHQYRNVSEEQKFMLGYNIPFNIHFVVSNTDSKGKRSKRRYLSDGIPMLSRDMASLAPIRTKPKRTYDGYEKRFSSEGEHTPYVIRKQLYKRDDDSERFAANLEQYGKSSGLYSTVGVTPFGNDASSPFEITITLESKPLRINSVGYGVSQILPVIVELFWHGKSSLITIQQPEVHLHPRAQAAFGEVVYNVALEEGISLFVETHSDYVIDRYRILMKKNREAATTQVVFFEHCSKGNRLSVMKLSEKGEYPMDQPVAFREFFLNENRSLLGI